MDPMTLALISKFGPELLKMLGGGGGATASAAGAIPGIAKTGQGVLGAVSGVTKGIDAFGLRHQARQLENAYHTPVYTTPASVQEATGLARNAYNGADYASTLKRALAQSLESQGTRNLVNSQASGGDVLAGIAGLNGNLVNNGMQIDADAQARKDALRGALEGQLNNQAQDERTAFKYNKDQPFQAANASATKMREAAREDIGSLIGDVGQAYAGGQEMKMLGSLNGGDKAKIGQALDKGVMSTPGQENTSDLTGKLSSSDLNHMLYALGSPVTQKNPFQAPFAGANAISPLEGESTPVEGLTSEGLGLNPKYPYAPGAQNVASDKHTALLNKLKQLGLNALSAPEKEMLRSILGNLQL